MSELLSSIQTPLSEKPNHTAFLCDRLGLGAPGRDLEQVPGGLHHKMWRLETDRGVYAIKQLAADTDVTHADTVSHYDATEAIAETFAGRGISAIHALHRNGRYLQIIEGAGYLVYPWTDAVALDRKNLSEEHALKIARLLARMHRVDIDVAGLKDTAVEHHPEDKIIALVQQATVRHTRDYRYLEQHLPAFLKIAACQEEARPILQRCSVISHGDLDQKNVLWSASGEPFLIDWERARRLNPTYETLLVALSWAGITSAFESILFERFISAYRQVGGVVDDDALEAVFACILGDWLDWLMFNVGRSSEIDDDARRALGSEQVDLALAALLRLERFLPRLVDRVREHAVVPC